jgi:uncharacterized protein
MNSESNEANSSADANRHFFGDGRLAYVQIPAINVHQSAAFYANVFGWEPRGGSPSHFSFTDATGDIIGAWVTGHEISKELGIGLYIYVHGLDKAIARIKSNGGQMVREPYLEGDVWIATFRDPAGNIIGIWQKEPR